MTPIAVDCSTDALRQMLQAQAEAAHRAAIVGLERVITWSDALHAEPGLSVTAIDAHLGWIARLSHMATGMMAATQGSLAVADRLDRRRPSNRVGRPPSGTPAIAPHARRAEAAPGLPAAGVADGSLQEMDDEPHAKRRCRSKETSCGEVRGGHVAEARSESAAARENFVPDATTADSTSAAAPVSNDEAHVRRESAESGMSTAHAAASAAQKMDDERHAKRTEGAFAAFSGPVRDPPPRLPAARGRRRGRAALRSATGPP